MITSVLGWIASLLLASAALNAQTNTTAPQTPPAPPEPTLTIPGATASTPPEIKIDVTGVAVDQTLIVQAPDKLLKDSPPPIIDVDVQVSQLLGEMDRRWVRVKARWLDCAKDATVCVTSFDWQGRKQLRLTVDKLPLIQSYGGTLDLIYNSKRHPFKLTIERKQQEPPDLRSTEYTTEIADFEADIVLRSKKDALSGVRIEVTPLISKSVPAFTPRLELNGKQPLAFSLGPFSQISLKIKATLPVADIYKGNIDVFYNGQRVALPIQITRADTAVPVKYRLNGIARDGVDFGYLGESKVAVRFDLEGLRSQPLTLDLPRLVGLTRKDSDKATSQAAFDRTTVEEYDEGDNIWKPISQGPKLDGRKPKMFRIVIVGLGPGEYTGTLSVANKDLNAQEQNQVGITVRRSWLIAVLLIMIGVLGSLMLRRWAQRDKPKLVAQRDIAQVNEDLQAMQSGLKDGTTGEQEVLVFLGKQLNTLSESWEEGVVATGDAQLKDMAAKLALIPRWVNLRRRLESTKLPPDKLTARNVAVATIKDAFQTVDSAKIADKISAVDQDITKDLAAMITARITSLNAEVARQEQSGAGKVLKQKLDEEVLGRLKQATDLAGNPDRLQEAAVKVGEANLVMLKLLATGLEAKLPATPPDKGIDLGDWQAAVADIRQELAHARNATDADTASAAYKKGYAIYLATMLQGIRTHLDAAAHRIAALNDDPAKTDAETKSQAASEMAENCDVLLNAGDTAGAQLEFESLDTAVRTLENTLRKAEAAKKAAETGAPPPTRESLVEPGVPLIAGSTVEGSLVRESLVFTGAPTRVIRPASELDAQIKAGEWKIAAIGFIIALAVGLRMLWLADPAWGDLDDLTVAILWGLGVHQTSALFLGQFDFATLIARITGTKAFT